MNHRFHEPSRSVLVTLRSLSGHRIHWFILLSTLIHTVGLYALSVTRSRDLYLNWQTITPTLELSLVTLPHASIPLKKKEGKPEQPMKSPSSRQKKPTVARSSISSSRIMRPAHLIGFKPPSYPVLSRKYSEEGTVIIAYVITATGHLQHVRVMQSSGYPRLDHAAKQALMNIKAQPELRSGTPVPTSGTQKFTFTLQQ